MRSRALVGLSSVVAILLSFAPLLVPTADASSIINDFSIRYQTTARGAIALIGNTSVTCPAADATCAANQGGAGGNDNDYVMVPVDIDGDPTTVNSSSATLALPAGSALLHAELYWEGQSSAANRDTVRFGTPGNAYVSVVASTVDASGAEFYGASADVTSLVAALADPNGDYTIADVAAITGSTNRHAGWSLVVAYENAADPLRNLTIFDGFAVINNTGASSVTTTVSGFVTPTTGTVTAQLGVVAGEGDLTLVDDQLLVNAFVASDAQNPATNAFNSSISRLGSRITTKNPDYVNQLGWDVDLIDVTGAVPFGATSADLTFTTTGDQYFPLALTFAVDVFEPSLDVPKTGTDVNGGGLLPGDAIDYQMVVTNAGNDPATNVVLTDPVPTNTTYVPGSLQIVAGPNAGAKTDATGDDQGEFAGGNVVFRLGTGATSAAGGTLGIGASTTVRFRVTLNSGTPPATVIHNQATIAYGGLTGGLTYSGASDGDSDDPGDQPVDIPVASPPNAVADSASTLEDTPVDVDVTANDTDVDGDLDPTSVTVTSGPSNGGVTVNSSTGVVTYTPDPDYSGPDSFTYQVCDDAGLCDSATVTLTVTAQNDPPTVVDDSATTDEDTPVDVDVVANDSDVDGTVDPTSVTVTSGPANGAVTVNPVTGVVTYTPDPDFSGTDTFTYEVCDNNGACSSGTVTVTVDPVPDGPVVVDDSATTDEDAPVGIDVLANDSDVDGNLDPTSVTVTSGPSNGGVSVNPSTGVVTYTPDPGFNGTDTFTYQVCDGTPLCASGTVTVTVDSIVDAPTVVDDVATTDEDVPVVIDVLANDSDADGNLDPTSVSVTSGPANGSVTIDPSTGAVTYTPDAAFSGTDTFTYQVCDLTDLCTSGTVTVTVGAAGQAPVVVNDAASVSENGTVVIDVLANDSDPDGDLDPSTVTVTSGPSHGTVSIDPVTGAVSYTPDPGFAGVDGFTYQVCDATALCTSGTVAVTVLALPPTDQKLAVTVDASQDSGWPLLPIIPLAFAAILVIIGIVRRQKPR